MCQEIYRAIKPNTDCEESQNYLEVPSNWVIKWLRKFNFYKCKVMCMWKNNPNYTYSLMALNKICITVFHLCILNGIYYCLAMDIVELEDVERR